MKQDRAEFAAWVRDTYGDDGPVRLDHDGVLYDPPFTAALFTGWQAAKASEAARQAEAVAWMTEITDYDPPARRTHGTVKSAQNYQEGAGGPARCRIVPLYTTATVVPDGYTLVPVEFITVLDDAPHINPSNYDHDQVCELNAAVFEALSMITESQG